MSPSPLLQTMIDAAREAGKGLAKDFAGLADLEIRKKGPADLVSQADERSEQTLKALLSKARPDYGFLGEEGGLTAGKDKSHTWICDPLDGTANFLCGAPLWAVNVALEREGEVIAAVTYNPVIEEMYWAEKGSGTFLNGKPIRVSTRGTLQEAVLACGIPFTGKPDHDLFVAEMEVLSAHVSGIRRMGSAAMDMAYVAAGRWDAYWERALQAWDMGAGVLLVTEAGGKATAATGGKLDLRGGAVCISNGLIHDDLIAALARADGARRKAVR